MRSTFNLSGSIAENSSGDANAVFGYSFDDPQFLAGYGATDEFTSPGQYNQQIEFDIFDYFFAGGFSEGKVFFDARLDAKAHSGGINSSATADFSATAKILSINYLRPDGTVDPSVLIIGDTTGIIYSSPLDDHAALTMDLVDLDGQPGIMAGEQFQVEMHFHDLVSDMPLFSGYADLGFDPNLLRIDGILYDGIMRSCGPALSTTSWGCFPTSAPPATACPPATTASSR